MKLVLLLLIVSVCCIPSIAQDQKQAILDPAEAGADFDIQGEYVGMVGELKIGIQIIADGGGKFRSVGYSVDCRAMVSMGPRKKRFRARESWKATSAC